MAAVADPPLDRPAAAAFIAAPARAVDFEPVDGAVVTRPRISPSAPHGSSRKISHLPAELRPASREAHLRRGSMKWTSLLHPFWPRLGIG